MPRRLVVDSAGYDPAGERLIILGPNGRGEASARINGRVVPDTIRLTVGERYRLRLVHIVVHIVADWTVRISLSRGDSVVRWRALAKDGAELPAHQQTLRAASLLAGPGETMDFEYQPDAPGLMWLDVVQRTGGWKTMPPIMVEPSRRQRSPRSIE